MAASSSSSPLQSSLLPSLPLPLSAISSPYPSVSVSTLSSSLDENCHTLSNEPRSSIRVQLDVGGVRYATTRSTLITLDASTSMLTIMFSEKNLFIFKPEADGTYFIDRNGALFGYLLDYLRNGRVHVPESLCHAVIQEAEYFGLHGLPTVLRAEEKETKEKAVLKMTSYERLSRMGIDEKLYRELEVISDIFIAADSKKNFSTEVYDITAMASSLFLPWSGSRPITVGMLRILSMIFLNRHSVSIKIWWIGLYGHNHTLCVRWYPFRTDSCSIIANRDASY